jgi:hypothetical protein
MAHRINEETNMKNWRARIYVLLLICLVADGCAQATQEISIRIPSVREYYPMLYKEAQKWRPDAYLDEARVFLFPHFSNSNVISASFYSPSEDLESLGIDFHKDGTITSEVFINEYPVYHHIPIAEDDWKIDSQEAMEIMLDEDGRQFINSGRSDCSYIILKRILPAQNQTVIWSLALWDCSNSMQLLYLDANSGELLDSSVIDIKPTRFPTSTP